MFLVKCGYDERGRKRPSRKFTANGKNTAPANGKQSTVRHKRDKLSRVNDQSSTFNVQQSTVNMRHSTFEVKSRRNNSQWSTVNSQMPTVNSRPSTVNTSTYQHISNQHSTVDGPTVNTQRSQPVTSSGALTCAAVWQMKRLSPESRCSVPTTRARMSTPLISSPRNLLTGCVIDQQRHLFVQQR